MTIRNLEHAVRPKSLAVLGASNRHGSLGQILMRNIIEAGFTGEIWPINPKYDEVAGRHCYARVGDIRGVPDFAVIATPPETVPGLIYELGEKGTRAAVVITAGITRDNGLRQAMLDAAKPFLFRIIGPNTVGLIVPEAKLNASFAHMFPRPGGLALLSQSGAIATSLIDWAADENVGFSQIVSLGDMADVDVGDYLDMLAGDGKTRAILMYLETIPNARKFMFAARAAARIKPVIAIKSGRHEQAAKAAATHTGALAGGDAAVDAALNRAGILRVHDLGELFDAAEVLARFKQLKRSRVGIVTNGGGAGVLAVDKLVDCRGELPDLSSETIARLDRALPSNWSRANPVDIIGDAPPERYKEAVAAVAADPNLDALLVLNCPTGLASASDAAKAVGALANSGMIGGKPVLTCWLGGKSAIPARHILQNSGLASFETPDDAAVAVSYLSDWSQAQKALMRVPTHGSEDMRVDRELVLAIFRKVAAEGRRLLTEPEAKAALAAYAIPVPEMLEASSVDEVEKLASKLLETSNKIVVKLLSKQISHKSDIGGVALNIETATAARAAAEKMVKRVEAERPDAAIDGFTIQPMIVRKNAQELLLGMSRDPVFGPTIMFGAGGTAVEVLADTATALPPLDDVLAGDLIDRTRISRLLAGYRDRPAANREAISHALNALSRMIVDFACIVSLDINPLIADADGVVALDARIEIDPDNIDCPIPNPDLAIRPYPSGWEKDLILKGVKYHVRPIKPADVSLYPTFIEHVSAEDLRLRLLAPRKHFPSEMLLRLTQLDYERDIALIAIDEESGELAGISRLSSDPDKEMAEFGLVVRTDLQGRGLGRALLEELIRYAKADGIARIDGFVLKDNTKMLQLCRELGFRAHLDSGDPGLSIVSLRLI